jgi:hypothetical protein
MNLTIEPDHRAILEAFDRRGVEYVLVGGVALQLNGWKGATADVDLTVATDEANVQRVNLALADLGAGAPAIGALGTAFETRHGRVELVRVADGIGEFPSWARRAETIDVDGLAVRVGHPEDLVFSKEAAGRPKDLDTLPLIRRDLIDAGRLQPDGKDVAPPDRETPAYLREALGERPQSRRAGKLWDNAAARIDEYRERWGISDPDRALGGEPVSTGEAKDRRIIERTLQRTERSIARALESPGPDVGFGR